MDIKYLNTYVEDMKKEGKRVAAYGDLESLGGTVLVTDFTGGYFALDDYEVKKSVVWTKAEIEDFNKAQGLNDVQVEAIINQSFTTPHKKAGGWD
jgi:hypothetical protein|tara:strand:+ start:42 stop:326 length:285 start_codon:yes stop_codon:yes gene_type:complete